MHPEIPRPKILGLSVILVVLSTLAFFPFTVDAVPRRQEIRSRLEDELAKSSPDYPASDVEQAVLITLIGLLVLSILLVLAELRSVVQMRRKLRGARTWLLTFTLIHVPVIALSPFIRDGGRWDLVSAVVQGGCLVLGVVIAYTAPVSKWLKAVARQGPIPLRTSSERQ